MIQLTKDLWVKADDHCYIVGRLNKQRRNETQGGRRARELNSQTYYTTMAQAVDGALKRAMRQGVKDNEITTLRQFIQEQEHLHAELEKLIAPLDGVGNAGEKRGEASQTSKTGNYIPQPLDSEKEA